MHLSDNPLGPYRYVGDINPPANTSSPNANANANADADGGDVNPPAQVTSAQLSREPHSAEPHSATSVGLAVPRSAAPPDAMGDSSCRGGRGGRHATVPLWYEGKAQHKGAASSPPPSEMLWGYAVPVVMSSF